MTSGPWPSYVGSSASLTLRGGMPAGAKHVGALATQLVEDHAQRRAVQREVTPERAAADAELLAHGVECGIGREHGGRGTPHAIDERAPHDVARGELGDLALERGRRD